MQITISNTYNEVVSNKLVCFLFHPLNEYRCTQIFISFHFIEPEFNISISIIRDIEVDVLPTALTTATIATLLCFLVANLLQSRCDDRVGGSSGFQLVSE